MSITCKQSLFQHIVSRVESTSNQRWRNPKRRGCYRSGRTTAAGRYHSSRKSIQKWPTIATQTSTLRTLRLETCRHREGPMVKNRKKNTKLLLCSMHKFLEINLPDTRLVTRSTACPVRRSFNVKPYSLRPLRFAIRRNVRNKLTQLRSSAL